MQHGVLIARGAYLEAGCEAGEVAAGLAVELEAMAAWLGLSEVIVERRGSLAGPLRRAVQSNG